MPAAHSLRRDGHDVTSTIDSSSTPANLTATPRLAVTGLKKSFTSGNGELAILKGVEMSLKAGDAVAVTGPSGSGKSTLLYIIGLLDSADSGSVLIDGTNAADLPATEQARFRGRHVGFVFQDHHLLPQLTVLENVLVPTLSIGGAGPQQRSRAEQLLGRVGLAERLHHRPAQLSGGERQRAAVCRALINSPALILADEPTGNLDRTTADAVGTLLLDMAREHGAALACVTHSMELARRFPQRLDLRDGKLVATT